MSECLTFLAILIAQVLQLNDAYCTLVQHCLLLGFGRLRDTTSTRQISFAEVCADMLSLYLRIWCTCREEPLPFAPPSSAFNKRY
jgi:hypothetical protein